MIQNAAVIRNLVPRAFPFFVGRSGEALGTRLGDSMKTNRLTCISLLLIVPANIPSFPRNKPTSKCFREIFVSGVILGILPVFFSEMSVGKQMAK